MINVARVTIKRLITEKPIFIAVFIVPIFIILLFSQMAASPDTGTVRYRLGILETQFDQLSPTQKESFNWFTTSDLSTLKDAVLTEKVAGGVLLKVGHNTIETLFATQPEFGSHLVSLYENGVPKSPERVDKTDQKRLVILNFLINYMMFSMIFIGTDLTTLKQENILRRLTAMPVKTVDLYGGQMIAFLSLLTLQIIEINVLIYIVIGAPLSLNLALSTGILVLMAALVLCFGLLVTRLTENNALIPVVCNLITIPLMMISGTFMPVDSMPILSKLKFFSPQYWVVDAIKIINQGTDNIGLHVVVLTVMTFAIFTLAVAGRKPART